MPKKAKKAKKAKTGKQHEAAARLAALKAKWDARHKDPNHAGGGDWLVDKPELSLDAGPFLQTLRALGNLTQDPRFADLHQFIMKSDLIDLATGKWTRFGTTVANPVTRDMCEMIEELIASGTLPADARVPSC
jgi:hypothetical protein